jgi:hypothetical protein
MICNDSTSKPVNIIKLRGYIEQLQIWMRLRGNKFFIFSNKTNETKFYFQILKQEYNLNSYDNNKLIQKDLMKNILKWVIKTYKLVNINI